MANQITKTITLDLDDATLIEIDPLPSFTPQYVQDGLILNQVDDGVSVGEKWVIFDRVVTILCFWSEDGEVCYYGDHGGHGTVEWLKRRCTKLI